MIPSRAAIRLHCHDNVATCLRPIGPGEAIVVGDDHLTAAEPVPFCHKIALADIPTGQPVIKYGQIIGETIHPIARGTHVHIHNMRSLRARSQVHQSPAQGISPNPP